MHVSTAFTQESNIIMAHQDKDAEVGRNGLTEVEVVKVRHANVGGCLHQFRGQYARLINACPSDYSQDDRQQAQPGKPSAGSMMGSFKGGRV
jgi:replicative DNA helicase